MMSKAVIEFDDPRLQTLKTVIDDVRENKDLYRNFEHVNSVLEELQILSEQVLREHEASPISEEQVSILKRATRIVAPMTRNFYKVFRGIQQSAEGEILKNTNTLIYTKITGYRAYPRLISWFDDYSIEATDREFLAIDNHVVKPSFKITHYSALDDERLLDTYGIPCFSLEDGDYTLYWYAKREVKTDSLRVRRNKRYGQFIRVEGMYDDTFFDLTQDEYNEIISWLITILTSQITALHTLWFSKPGLSAIHIGKSIAFFEK